MPGGDTGVSECLASISWRTVLSMADMEDDRRETTGAGLGLHRGMCVTSRGQISSRCLEITSVGGQNEI